MSDETRVPIANAFGCVAPAFDAEELRVYLKGKLYEGEIAAATILGVLADLFPEGP